MHHTTLATFAIVAAIGFAAATAGVAKEPISVTMDRAKVMKISAPAETVIIGNPGIADATIHDKRTLIITGRTVGLTNLVILDAKGEPIADEIISVEKIQAGLISIQRGASRFSYNCTPNCNTMLEVGDNPGAFESALQQINSRNSLAIGAASSAAPAQ